LLLVGELSPEGDYAGTSLNRFIGELATLVDDSFVKRIVLWVDSPGGTYAMTPEATQAVIEARKVKPVVTFTAGWMASGAFWLGSSAESITSTPSAEAIGSIGALSVHVDQSKMLDDMGIKATIIRSPDGKGRGNSLEPLDDETRTILQERVDSIAREFYSAVVRHRGGRTPLSAVVKSNARTFRAREAQERGFVDRIQPWTEFFAGVQNEVRLERVSRIETLSSPGLRAALLAGLAKRGLIETDTPPTAPDAETIHNRLAEYLEN